MTHAATQSTRFRSATGSALSFEAALDRAMENLQQVLQPNALQHTWRFDATVNRVHVRAVRGDAATARDEYEVRVRGRLVAPRAAKSSTVSLRN